MDAVAQEMVSNKLATVHWRDQIEKTRLWDETKGTVARPGDTTFGAERS